MTARLIESAGEIYVESNGVVLSIEPEYGNCYIETAVLFDAGAYQGAIAMAEQRGYSLIPEDECPAEETEEGGLRIYLYDTRIECEAVESAA